MSTSHRFKILINGKWQGGSFATRAEADAAAKVVRKSPEQTITVEPKGESMLAPTPAVLPEPAPTPAVLPLMPGIVTGRK